MALHEVYDEYGNKQLLDDQEYVIYTLRENAHKLKVYAWVSVIAFPILGAVAWFFFCEHDYLLRYFLIIGIAIGAWVFKKFNGTANESLKAADKEEAMMKRNREKKE